MDAPRNDQSRIPAKHLKLADRGWTWVGPPFLLFGIVLFGCMVGDSPSEGRRELRTQPASFFALTAPPAPQIRLDTAGIGDGRGLWRLPGLLGMVDAADGQIRYTANGLVGEVRGLSRKGDGPGELMRPTTVAVDPSRQRIAVYDRIGRISVFDLNRDSLLWVAAHRVPATFPEIVFLPDGRVLAPANPTSGAIGVVLSEGGGAEAWGPPPIAVENPEFPISSDIFLRQDSSVVVVHSVEGVIRSYDFSGRVLSEWVLPSTFSDAAHGVAEEFREGGAEVISVPVVRWASGGLRGRILLGNVARSDTALFVVDLNESTVRPLLLLPSASEEARDGVRRVRSVNWDDEGISMLTKNALYQFEVGVPR